jgi:broad specificity phosphatase PhoE
VATALGAADGFGVEVPRRADPGFLEIVQGEWEGLPGAEIERRWPEVIAGWRRTRSGTGQPAASPSQP